MYTLAASELTGGAKRVTFQADTEIIEIDLPIDIKVTPGNYDVSLTATEPIPTDNTVIIMHGIVYHVNGGVTLISCGGLLVRMPTTTVCVNDNVYISITHLGVPETQ